MSNLNVAVIGVPDYSKELGKAGTISDITFFNLKKEEVTVTIIEPSRYPEKLSSLFYAISMALLVLGYAGEMRSVLRHVMGGVVPLRMGIWILLAITADLLLSPRRMSAGS